MRVPNSIHIIHDMLREITLTRQEVEDLCEFVRSRMEPNTRGIALHRSHAIELHPFHPES
jgi:hypothetical protein